MIDPTTNLGRLRLRVADFQDIPLLPDIVYTQTLADTSNNLPASAKILAMYILGVLSSRTHRKLATMEVFGSDYFKQYKEFIMLSFTNPNFMDLSPIPIDMSGTTLHPLIQFQQDWNLNFVITQSQQLSWTAFGNLSTSQGEWVWPT